MMLSAKLCPAAPAPPYSMEVSSGTLNMDQPNAQRRQEREQLGHLPHPILGDTTLTTLKGSKPSLLHAVRE
jgi:hypothetical protein